MRGERKGCSPSPEEPREGREVLRVTIFYNFNWVSFSMRETLAKRIQFIESKCTQTLLCCCQKGKSRSYFWCERGDGACTCLGQENTGTLFFWLYVGGGFCYLAVCFCQVAKRTWF